MTIRESFDAHLKAHNCLPPRNELGAFAGVAKQSALAPEIRKRLPSAPNVRGTHRADRDGCRVQSATAEEASLFFTVTAFTALAAPARFFTLTPVECAPGMVRRRLSLFARHPRHRLNAAEIRWDDGGGHRLQHCVLAKR